MWCRRCLPVSAFIIPIPLLLLSLAGCGAHDREPAASAKPEVPPPNPAYSAASIAPAGSREVKPLAPGRIASIYGLNLGPMTPCIGSPEAGRFEAPSPERPHQTLIETRIYPTRLCDTRVQVGGVPAGLLYVSNTQINFKVPQSTPARGTTTVLVTFKNVAGPAVSVALGGVEGRAAPAGKIADAMFAGLQQVKWQRRYSGGGGAGGERCTAVRPRQVLRGGLHGHAYHCVQDIAGDGNLAAAESYYHPVNPADPQLQLLRADLRPSATPYPELSGEVEQLLIPKLTRAYGAGEIPEQVLEIGLVERNAGLAWRTGALTIFLHRQRYYAAPGAVREGVVLIAVRDEVMAERAALKKMHQEDSSQQLPAGVPAAAMPEPERARAELQTRAALVRLLRQSTAPAPATGADGGEKRAAALVEADELARRLANLLVVRSIENGSEKLTLSEGAASARLQLASHGVRYGEIGHYSGDLAYDYSLFARAWAKFPETPSGQRAFLALQRLGCSTPLFGCDGPNCFLSVIKQGEAFLERFPDSPFRQEQLYHLALAHETWWSLGQAEPGDISAQGAKVTRDSAERARQRSVALYEQLMNTALPDSREAVTARLALPRLKLRLDTAERTFFCFSC